VLTRVAAGARASALKVLRLIGSSPRFLRFQTCDSGPFSSRRRETGGRIPGWLAAMTHSTSSPTFRSDGGGSALRNHFRLP